MISKSRLTLFGIGTIAVLLAHSTLIVTVPKVLQVLLGNGAIWAVRMFFFLSAIGLVCSANKNGLVVREYYLKRVRRVLIPFLLIGIPFYFWQEILLYHRPLHFLTKVTLLEYWISGKGHVWYLAVLLPLYLVFPLLYRVLKSCRGKHELLTIGWIVFDVLLHKLAVNYCDMVENMFTSVFAFLFGMLVADRVDSLKKRDAFLVVVGIAAFPIVSVLTDGNNVLVRYSSCFVGICMSFLFAYIFIKIRLGYLDKLLKTIGTYSLELYITNVFLIEIVNCYFDFAIPVVRLALILGGGIILSYLLQRVSNCVRWMLDNKL